MGRTWIPRRGLHLLLSHPFHSSSHEDLTAETLLSFWKLSLVEPLYGEGEVQALLGRRRPQLSQKTELYVGKLSTGGRVKEKQLQKYLQDEEDLENEDTEEEVGLKYIQASGKGNHKKLHRSNSGSSSSIALLKACAIDKDLQRGREIHADIVSRDPLMDSSILAALMSMYSKCGALEVAQDLFDKAHFRNVVSWNALMDGYIQHGHALLVLFHFQQMQQECVFPNAVTLVYILKACGTLGALKKGEEVHTQLVSNRLLERDSLVGKALLDMYTKCRSFRKVELYFDFLNMFSGYDCFQPEEALTRSEGMQLESFSPIVITLLCILRACGITGALYKGQEAHARIMKEGWLTKDARIADGLVGMYAWCGLLPKTQQVFDELPARSVALWTALIAGYAQAGKVDVAFELFNTMIQEGIEPDLVTFITLLNACSSDGLLEEGQMCFEVLRGHHRMIPALEHFTRMVDLFGRAGDLGKAVDLISKMPFSPDRTMWHSLLGACQKWGDTNFGRWAFKHAVQLNEQDSSAYVIMSNICVAARRHQYSETVKGSEGAHIWS